MHTTISTYFLCRATWPHATPAQCWRAAIGNFPRSDFDTPLSLDDLSEG